MVAIIFSSTVSIYFRKSVWEGFINNEDDIGSKKSRRKAARDFKVNKINNVNFNEIV